MKRSVFVAFALVLAAGAVSARPGNTAPEGAGPAPETAPPAATAAAPVAAAPAEGPTLAAAAAPARGAAADLVGRLRRSFDPKVGLFAGFRSPEDLDRARTGPSIPMYVVDTDPLGRYDGVSSADALLRPVPLTTQLVYVDGRVGSALVLRDDQGTWKPMRVGGANRAKLIDRVGAELARSYGVAPGALFLVDLPSLGVELLGYRTKGSTMLVALADVPELGLRGAQPVNAPALLASLAPFAKPLPH
jgi:hypothetical protein